MDRPPPNSATPMAGGFLIALGLIIGGVVGLTRGNAQLWLLGGALAGVAAAIVVWLRDRRS